MIEGGGPTQEQMAEAIATLRSLPDAVVAINRLTAALKEVLPVVQSTASSATLGASGAPPAQVAGYLVITLPSGASARVPYYNP